MFCCKSLIAKNVGIGKACEIDFEFYKHKYI